MNNNVINIADLILNSKRPRDWRTIGGFEFLIEAVTQMDYARIRAAASSVVERDGEMVQVVDSHLLAMGWLETVKDWRGVTAGHFGVPGIPDDRLIEPMPFSQVMLEKFLENRLQLAQQIIEAARDVHMAHQVREAEDEKNLPTS